MEIIVRSQIEPINKSILVGLKLNDNYSLEVVVLNKDDKIERHYYNKNEYESFSIM